MSGSVSRLTIAILVVYSGLLPAQQRQEPEVYSPLGKAFFARPDSTGVIAKADAALAEGGDKADLILGAAQARDELLRFSDSIPIYTRGMQLYPDDVRFPRFRGHRLISIRRFDAALADLKLAAEIAPASFDVSFHLGLAYYFRGDFNHAAREYSRCLAMADKPRPEFLRGLPRDWRSCYAMDDDTRVAMTDWNYRALRRAGKPVEAKALLEKIKESMAVKENVSSLKALLVYKGARKEDETLADPPAGSTFATLGYGIAVFSLAEGHRDHACVLLERVAADENWSTFGVIGAETDLARGLCASGKK